MNIQASPIKSEPIADRLIAQCVNEFPQDWGAARLRHLAREPLAYGANEAALEDSPNFPRFIRITDINEDGSLRSDIFKSLAPEIAESYLLKEGDVLLARSGATVGKAFIYRKEWGQACFAGYLIKFSCNRDLLLPEFLFQFTQSSIYWAQVKSGTIQSTIQNFSAEKYSELFIPLPPIERQQKICEYLDRETQKIDSLIAAKKRLLELLAEKRRSMITQAVTRGLTVDVSMKDSGVAWIGQIPEDWNIVSLSFLAKVKSGVAKGRNLGSNQTMHVPYLRVANVQDGYVNLDDVANIEVLPEEVSAFSLRRGDVLMNEGGDADKLGRGAVWDAAIEPCLHQNHVFAVRCHGIEPEWLSTLTGSSYAKAYFESRAKQSTNLASISSTNLKELPVVLPPRDMQISIVNELRGLLTKLDALCNMTSHGIALLQERRTSLISAAVTGQLSIPD
jgi:type I restriction enzyme, S subunit